MQVLIFTDVNGVLGFGRYAGAYKVATELRLAGYSTQVVEFLADLSLKEIEDIAFRFINSETLFVGFSTTLLIKKSPGAMERLIRSDMALYSNHLPQDDDFVQEMFAIFRRRNPKLKIVMGGGKTSLTNLKGVDYWVWGQADRSVVALANALNGGPEVKADKAREGLVISSKDYHYHDFNTSRILWQKNDLIFHNEHLPIEIDRGCIFRCAFCANLINKKKYEFEKDIEVLRDELLHNYDHFGTTGYMFSSDTFNDRNEKVIAICDMIRKLPFKMEWIGYGRVDGIAQHPEQRDLLLESGLKAILFGIETLHPVAARNVGKGVNPERIKETLHYVRETWKNKVVMTGSFIVGLPEEPEESIWETAAWLQNDDCPLDDIMFNPLNIRVRADDPDSPVSRIALDPAKYGYKMAAAVTGTGVSTHGPVWESEFMNKSRAVEIAKEVQQILSKDKPFGDWAVYSRLRNIGLSEAEVMAKNLNGKEFFAKADMRKDQLRQVYLSALMNGEEPEPSLEFPW